MKKKVGKRLNRGKVALCIRWAARGRLIFLGVAWTVQTYERGGQSQWPEQKAWIPHVQSPLKRSKQQYDGFRKGGGGSRFACNAAGAPTVTTGPSKGRASGPIEGGATSRGSRGSLWAVRPSIPGSAHAVVGTRGRRPPGSKQQALWQSPSTHLESKYPPPPGGPSYQS